MKNKKSLLIEGLVKEFHRGKDLAKALVDRGLVGGDFDKKVKEIVRVRKELLERLK